MRAGLVPLTFKSGLLEETKPLSGVSVDPVITHSADGLTFEEALLFTHRGLSGPAILQISSYWNDGEDLTIDLTAGADVFAYLKTMRHDQPKSMTQTILSNLLPKRLAMTLAGTYSDKKIADLPDIRLREITDRVQKWSVRPNGSEGYRTAEVTLGGVDTREISSKTFACNKLPGLFFIGEVLDVTGHLGGHNFQWAWSSSWCAGQYA